MKMDRLFVLFMTMAFIVLMVYTIGMITVLENINSNVGRAMLVGFSGAFSAIVGLGSGYFLGRNVSINGNAKRPEKPKEDGE
jgi:hypothetical protein